jgi:drug/metabolite transporter (DMT)-like permease
LSPLFGAHAHYRNDEALGIAARDEAAVAAVMSSQFAIVTALGGYLLWGERIGRQQVLGVGLVLGGVAGLTLLQA